MLRHTGVNYPLFDEFSFCLFRKGIDLHPYNARGYGQRRTRAFILKPLMIYPGGVHACARGDAPMTR